MNTRANTRARLHQSPGGGNFLPFPLHSSRATPQYFTIFPPFLHCEPSRGCCSLPLCFLLAFLQETLGKQRHRRKSSLQIKYLPFEARKDQERERGVLQNTCSLFSSGHIFLMLIFSHLQILSRNLFLCLHFWLGFYFQANNWSLLLR